MRLPLLALACWAGLADGHDLWLDVQPAAPAPDAPVTVIVGGGHYFPSSDSALSDRLVRSLQVRQPDGQLADLPSALKGKQREAMLTPREPGLHVLTLVVQKPQLAQPEYWARALLPVASGPASPYPAAGVGLEIIPRGDLAALRVGQVLQLEIRHDGAPLEGKLQVVAEGGGADWLTARAETPAKLTLRKPGRYLITFAKGPQSCSLTFTVPVS